MHVCVCTVYVWRKFYAYKNIVWPSVTMPFGRRRPGTYRVYQSFNAILWHQQQKTCATVSSLHIYFFCCLRFSK